jgi:hypothetical protein
LGSDGVTASGRRYAGLAAGGVRSLALTEDEAHALVTLATPCLQSSRASLQARARELEHLEARGLVERQVDGQIVRTDAGELVAGAVADAAGSVHPVTPAVVRLLEAVRLVAGVEARVRRARIAHDQWREVERVSGLSRGAFAGAQRLAHLAGYISADALQARGSDVLAAAALLNDHW